MQTSEREYFEQFSGHYDMIETGHTEVVNEGIECPYCGELVNTFSVSHTPMYNHGKYIGCIKQPHDTYFMQQVLNDTP